MALGAAALLIVLLWLAGKVLLPALRPSDEPSMMDREFGATVERLDPATAQELGAGAQTHQLVVTSVAEGGPADRAGLRAGDVIESADGQPARSLPDLAAQVLTPPTRLIVNRGGDHVIVLLPAGDANRGRS